MDCIDEVESILIGGGGGGLEKILEIYELKLQIKVSLCVRKPTIWIPTRSDTNRTVQSQKQA